MPTRQISPSKSQSQTQTASSTPQPPPQRNHSHQNSSPPLIASIATFSVLLFLIVELAEATTIKEEKSEAITRNIHLQV
ncbi:hypothetical protein CFP56_002248 [Quercus suber]|uniref:Transmembrane protein n=1 Tax=Quercus suber TaxID=58331 RepID=A0AAW0LE64_QUESU